MALVLPATVPACRIENDDRRLLTEETPSSFRPKQMKVVERTDNHFARTGSRSYYALAILNSLRKFSLVAAATVSSGNPLIWASCSATKRT